jgi:hypothetical protein
MTTGLAVCQVRPGRPTPGAKTIECEWARNAFGAGVVRRPARCPVQGVLVLGAPPACSHVVVVLGGQRAQRGAQALLQCMRDRGAAPCRALGGRVELGGGRAGARRHRPRALAQPGRELVGRRGSGDPDALRGVTAQPGEDGQVLALLDTLGDDAQLEMAREVDDPPHDGHVAARAHVRHEAAVDRGKEAALRVLPAHERLDAEHDLAAKSICGWKYATSSSRARASRRLPADTVPGPDRRSTTAPTRPLSAASREA